MSTKFSWELAPTDGSVDFGDELNRQLPLLVRKLLAQRGISGRENAERFLKPKLADLGDPFELREMDAAVARIFRAVDHGEHVCIYGDYDVDGVSSVTLLHAVLTAFGLCVDCFIPVRTREGYGLSPEGIRNAIAQCGEKPSLLITVDCGTSSVDEVRALQDSGTDVIILDHHEPSPLGRPPAVAVVNAKLEEDSPLTYLCSAGVVFKLAHALLKRRRLPDFDLRHYLDIVAIATVADIVPLVSENRLLTRHGLRLMSSGGNIGLQALNQVTGLNRRPNASHISFRIGPRLNAAGRMDSPRDALELLMTDDPERARQLAMHLEQHNRARQTEEERIRHEAMQMIEQNSSMKNDHVIVLGSRSWHPGVVGIVASLLMRRFHKPAFIISLDENGIGKGSGRSIPGVSLVQAIRRCSADLISGGGHDMAAGIVIREDQIDAFRRSFNRFVDETTSADQLKPVLHIDAEVSFADLTLDLLDSYELLEPFGNSNPQPFFMARNVRLTEAPRHLQGNHLRLCLRQGNCECDAMYFNAGRLQLPDPPWDIVFTIDRNTWRGRTSLSMSIQDLRPAEKS
ncbi:MAG TPA: single-stranded-DNA-specific exonuclease RecJ [Candidatus Akkermansia intestinigallinarum]|uniref:Single-stranded-DNA-specific exonuclease RecJ n=1 Tax=Candidatus Akkermansia intestinigallinarum TaxID=2838431 RepID=A0A9D1V9V7_9BACT|nr:single-stranded-DNA-specific exonuclease RecJ [Candidatus Akkermansia intestinigallinarum]